VQGELTTREYDRTINVPTGKGKSIEHTIQQFVVELKADIIRPLDPCTANSQQSDAVESSIDEVPS
jgi:single-strand DNA-binding protein